MAQWFADGQSAEKNSVKEEAIRKSLLPGLKQPKLHSAISNDNFQVAKKQAGKMATDYEEQVVGHVEVTAECGRLGQTMLPMLHLDVVAPVMTEAYYAVLTLNPASAVTVTPGKNEKAGSWLDQAWAAACSVIEGGDSEDIARIGRALMYKISAPEDPEAQSEAEARELKARPGRIQLGFYDAKLEADIKRRHRALIQKESIQLIRVQQLEQRLSEVKEPKAEVEFHPYGLVDQYKTASDLYEPDRL